jgi:hypothetical protein
MSQINDALKRAQDIQLKNMPTSMSPMLPVESKDAPHGANWLWPVVVVLFLLLFAGLCIAISAGSHAEKKIAAEPAPSPTPEVKAVAAPVPRPAAPTITVLAETATKTGRLQGIVYDPVHPYAIVSGKTVFVGDMVDGQHVTAISRDAVMLAGNGRTNRLHVGY